MGGGSYSSKDWAGFSSSRLYHDPKTTVKDIYRKGSLDDALNPKKFRMRESVDGPDNPESTPLIIGLDVTGSMSPVLESIARKGLNTICEEVYKRKPITNPHICVLGIGDVECDHAPFQATQFEADIRIFEQLEKLFLESGGGGNNHESYILAWYFAQYRTKTDSFSKRGRKGFIFTIGDEEITPSIDAGALKKFLGDSNVRSFTAPDLYDLVASEWNVYHIIIKEGDHASRSFGAVKKSWESVLGVQRTIPLDDHTKLGEIIVSVLEMAAGKSLKDTAGSWDKKTGLLVDSALKNLGGSLSSKSVPKAIESYL